MIVVTGGAGFIGSALIWNLNQQGREDVVVVDELGTDNKWFNLSSKRLLEVMHKNDLKTWLSNQTPSSIDFIIHMGACSTTTEADADYLIKNNTQYSIDLFKFATENAIPFIYASSAATYGNGDEGYSDSNSTTAKLRPINKYGFSKHVFDQWVLQQKKVPPFWAGLKFFNVYGPNEFHKGGQASVVFHAFPQVKSQGTLRLFKSYKKGIGHGEQKRDFVYIKDVVKVIDHLMQNKDQIDSAIFNVGTGEARTFADLGRSVFTALGKKESFEWIEMPDNIRPQYQYFTQADLEKLRSQAGYTHTFSSLEEGVRDYTCEYLDKGPLYL